MSNKYLYSNGTIREVIEPTYEEITCHDKWDEVFDILKNEGYSSGSEEELDRIYDECKRRIKEIIFASLPSIKVEGNHNWKEGQELILDVDFRIDYFYPAGGEYVRTVAIPIQSAQEPEGEKDRTPGYYCVKFYNHEKRYIMLWNGKNFVRFPGEQYPNDEIESFVTQFTSSPKEQGSAPAEIEKNEIIEILKEVEEDAPRSVGRGCNYEQYILPSDYPLIARKVLLLLKTKSPSKPAEPKKLDREEIEKEIKSFYVEPKKESWTDIFVKWARSQTYSKTIDGLQHFLDCNYLPPVKKKQ